MSTIGFFFIFIGMLAIVIGLIQMLNIFSVWPSKNVREGIDITEPDVQRKNGRFMLVGLVLVAIGFLLMWAGGA
jgi:hypothetical protein